ncbi:hypothetical protein U1Q18_013566, partial [Sarracenia purpurea var. burkii]
MWNGIMKIAADPMVMELGYSCCWFWVISCGGLALGWGGCYGEGLWGSLGLADGRVAGFGWGHSCLAHRLLRLGSVVLCLVLPGFIMQVIPPVWSLVVQLVLLFYAATIAD